MIGKKRPKHEYLDELRINIRNLSKYPHLKEIARKILEVIDFVSVSTASNKEIESLIKYVQTILPILPKPKGDKSRFLFDAYMIASFQEILERTGEGLSRMILPICGEEWSHRILRLPSFDLTKVPRVDLISFKGEPQLYDVVLIDYPWLYHELGHILLFEYRESFIPSFTQVLDKVVKGLKARSLGDSAINKRRAEATIEKLERFWGVADGPWSWAIEIGSDVFALWMCGPSFLAAFDKELENREPNPYLISKQHPPYEIRSIALMRASVRLGWSKYTASLKDKVECWKKTYFKKNRTNEYVSYANNELLDGAISSTLNMCSDLRIQVCDQNKVKAIGKIIRNNSTLDFGSELVIAAWLVNQELGRSKYNSWQREIVEDLNKNIRL